MDYSFYKNVQEEVEAGKFQFIADVGEIVQNLLDEGCTHISVTVTPINPQLDVSSTITLITFLHGSIVQSLFIGDYLVFFPSGEVIAYPSSIFEEEFIQVVGGAV